MYVVIERLTTWVGTWRPFSCSLSAKGERNGMVWETIEGTYS
jgi:hypothetical protein